MIYFFDTSGLLSLFNKKDPRHEVIHKWFTQSIGNKKRFLLTNLVFGEALTLTRARIGINASIQLGIVIRQSRSFEVIRVTIEDEEEAWRLFSSHKDNEYSYVDCLSFIVMKKRGITKAVTADKHFSQFGFEMV